MFKLIKYEYRRNLGFIVAAIAGILAAQGYFMIGVWRAHVDSMVGAGVILFLLSILAAFGVFLYSVSLYSRELNAKTSYLTFMTPVTPTQILASKLLATFFLGVMLVAILVLFCIWDFSQVVRLFPTLNPMRQMIDQFLAYVMTSVDDILLAVLAFELEFLAGFFALVSLAYLAITVSATILQNKRFKGLLSLLIFAALATLVNRAAVWVAPSEAMYDTPGAYFVDAWPVFAVYVACMLLAFFASARLLKKHVSL